MEVTVENIVNENSGNEPVIIEDEYGECLYDGWLSDVPENLYGRVVESTGWQLAARRHLIKVEAEPDGEFSAISEYDYKLGEFWTDVAFGLTTEAWEKLQKTAEWKAFLKRLGKAQSE